jgi:hypothetical protein
MPSAGSGLQRIAVDPTNPNRIWWCGADRLGYIEVLQ